MIIHESVEIEARPVDVWALLVDPQRLADWHVKLIKVDRSGTGPAYVGERFSAAYVMNVESDRQHRCTTEVLRCEPWATLVFRHHLQDGARLGYVDESYQLLPRDDGARTRVEHFVDLSNSGIPWWARALMWCITRVGKPAGDGILMPLKHICEIGKSAK